MRSKLSQHFGQRRRNWLSKQIDIPCTGNKKDILFAVDKADAAATVLTLGPDLRWRTRTFKYLENLDIGKSGSPFGIVLNGQNPGVYYICCCIESGLN